MMKCIWDKRGRETHGYKKGDILIIYIEDNNEWRESISI